MKHNIKANTTKFGSWKTYRQRAISGKPPNRRRTQAEIVYEQEWKNEIKQTHQEGFTWAYIWTKEKARRVSADKYHSMTSEQKKRKSEQSYKAYKLRCKSDTEYKQKKSETQKKWRAENKAWVTERHNEWVRNNPDKIKQYRKRAMEKPAARAKANMSRRFRDLMKTARKGGSQSFSKIIGCTTKELAHHLESQFDEHMTWDNYGTYWHVDHIIPCAAFDHEDSKQVSICWHWSNLQPLEAKANMAKSDKYDEEQMNLLMAYTPSKK